MRGIKDNTEICECGCGGCFGDGGTTFIGDVGQQSGVVESNGTFEGWGGDIGDGGTTF